MLRFCDRQGCNQPAEPCSGVCSHHWHFCAVHEMPCTCPWDREANKIGHYPDCHNVAPLRKD